MVRNDLFKHPIPILVGLGFPTTIDGVLEAYQFLNEWPPSSRNGDHEIALNACKAALDGEIDTETAHSTFVAFAARHDLLTQQRVIAFPKRPGRQATSLR
jgi:hypothetical protein